MVITLLQSIYQWPLSETWVVPLAPYGACKYPYTSLPVVNSQSLSSHCHTLPSHSLPTCRGSWLYKSQLTTVQKSVDDIDVDEKRSNFPRMGKYLASLMREFFCKITSIQTLAAKIVLLQASRAKNFLLLISGKAHHCLLLCQNSESQALTFSLWGCWFH